MKTTIIGMLLSPFLLIGQQNSGAWTNIGPSPAAVIPPIVVDPRGGGTMFIGLYAGGIRKSTDNGATWSSVNTGLTDLRIQTFAMDASGPQTVYAGAAVSSKALMEAALGKMWKQTPGSFPLPQTQTGPE